MMVWRRDPSESGSSTLAHLPASSPLYTTSSAFATRSAPFSARDSSARPEPAASGRRADSSVSCARNMLRRLAMSASVSLRNVSSPSSSAASAAPSFPASSSNAYLAAADGMPASHGSAPTERGVSWIGLTMVTSSDSNPSSGASFGPEGTGGDELFRSFAISRRILRPPKRADRSVLLKFCANSYASAILDSKCRSSSSRRIESNCSGVKQPSSSQSVPFLVILWKSSCERTMTGVKFFILRSPSANSLKLRVPPRSQSRTSKSLRMRLERSAALVK
mmetsp:Transcript_86229/g.230304  ORF Transcript_86229/g.230304 Transcript_86229/m.230304 type:complete len:278 (-) Transcript_86229:228-1061(-)